MPVTLTPRFRADGKYDGYFFPAKAAEYTFHFSGTINGDPIDERVVSGKDGFNSVEEPLVVPTETQPDNFLAQAQQSAKEAKDARRNGDYFRDCGYCGGANRVSPGGLRPDPADSGPGQFNFHHPTTGTGRFPAWKRAGRRLRPV